MSVVFAACICMREYKIEGQMSQCGDPFRGQISSPQKVSHVFLIDIMKIWFKG